jgi:transcriptional regulator with XRE-family HTH domain
MRKHKEVLRLHSLGLTQQQIARSCSISQSTVHEYRSGQNVERRLPILSTYLGHVHVADTYWYLTGCPELMGLAVKRFEDYWEKQS